MKQTVVNIQNFTSVFLYPFLGKEVARLANRTRTSRNEFHLNDDEQYILDEKFKLSGMKSKSAFLRKLILYGYVYDVDYSYLRNMSLLPPINLTQKRFVIWAGSWIISISIWRGIHPPLSHRKNKIQKEIKYCNLLIIINCIILITVL